MKTARARSALAVLGLTSTAACFDVLAPYEAGGGASAGGAGADIDVPSGGGADEQGGGKITLAEEACDNGVDDDGDGLVDCADSDGCPGFVCHPWPATGWEGPLIVRDADDDTPCPGAYPRDRGVGALLDDDQDPCSCACGPMKGRCRGDLELFDDGACATAAQTLATGDVGACGLEAGSAGSGRLSLESVELSCGASAPPVVPARAVRTCEGGPGGGCPEGSACLRPMEPGTLVCVRGPRDAAACPAGFDERHLLVAQPASALACSDEDCACDPIVAPTCAGAVSLRQSSCTSAVVGVVSTEATCASFGGSVAFGAVDLGATPSGGSCRATSSPAWSEDAAVLCCATQI